MTDESFLEPPPVDRLLDELRSRIEERRKQGLYPPGLEDELDEHFRRIAGHRMTPDLDDVRTAMAEMEHRAAFNAAYAPVDSRFPGGRAFHSAVTKAVSRPTQGILEQVQAFADSTREVLRAVVSALENPQAHVHADLVGLVDSLFERLAAYERTPVDDAAALAHLRRRVEHLEASEAVRQFRPWFRNDRFEEEFRGSRDQLFERYRDLVPLFVESQPVLDIGCGRGEFLTLLEGEGIQCMGVEIDPELVEECREAGLDVRLEDAVTAVGKAKDGSLGGIVLIQVVEHMYPQQVLDLVALARDKLRPGAHMLVETVNPQSLYVFAHSFYLDPTHHHPVHPAYLTFVFREAGFSEVRIDWRSPPAEDESLAELPAESDDARVANENARRLNRLLFAPQDYALIATR